MDLVSGFRYLYQAVLTSVKAVLILKPGILIMAHYIHMKHNWKLLMH